MGARLSTPWPLSSRGLTRSGGPRIELICVGTELLMGKPNAHTAYLSEKLEEGGLCLVRETVVSDDPAEMARVFAGSWRRSDIVLCTGGLGPTFDDVTREVWARVTGRRLVFHETIAAHIQDRFRRRGLAMPAINRRQAYVLSGAQVLSNDQGTAPGQLLQRGKRTLVLLPGPGRELRSMVEHQVLPWLKGRFSAGERATRVWRIFGLPESAVDERISPWIAQKPSGSLRSVWGILAHGNIVEVKLTVSGKTSADLQKRLEMVEKGLKMSFGPALFGTGADTLESVVGRLLRAQKSVLAVAESCTGGLLAQKITSVPGSSDYFWGGWVTYDNRAKRRLGVTAATLRKEGAVSRTCAVEMAQQARRRSGGRVAMAITGIAGPDGGNVQKPLGRVYIALASNKKHRVWEKNFTGDRSSIREQSALWALYYLKEFLEEPLR